MAERGCCVKTFQKPTAVTHSCTGHLTGGTDLNLIVAKYTRLEVFCFTHHGLLQPLLDLPIYGRISMLEVFRPTDKEQDVLYMLTSGTEFHLCVLQWDSNSSNLRTSWNKNVSEPDPLLDPLPDKDQIGICDPHHRLIVLYMYYGLLKVIPFAENNGHPILEHAINIRLDTPELIKVVDISFLYDSKPTIVVMYKDIDLAYRLKTYVVSTETGRIDEGCIFWKREISDQSEYFGLFALPPPLDGVVLMGVQNTIHLNGVNGLEKLPSCVGGWEPKSITRAYRMKTTDLTFLVGDHRGGLHQISIKREGTKITNLHRMFLGETSIASTITFFNDNHLYVGSSGGPSQLIKLVFEAASPVEVQQSCVNFGPIRDLCIVKDQNQIVTCSGTGKDGSIGVIPVCFQTIEEVLFEIQDPCTHIWSLSGGSIFVLSFTLYTGIKVRTGDQEFKRKIVDGEGFFCTVPTLFCHDAIGNRFLQVTEKSVRLICARGGMLLDEWLAPIRSPISIAAGNSAQVLLAARDHHLFYLEIHDKSLTLIAEIETGLDMSCLDLNPVGDDSKNSLLAAVGTWSDTCVRIYSLPQLVLLKTEDLGGVIHPRSLLICAFEGVSYLLCGLGDGHVVKFLLNKESGFISDRRRVALGTMPIALYSFSNGTLVIAVSNKPTVIHSFNNELLFKYVDIEKVGCACPLNLNDAAFSNCFVFEKESRICLASIADVKIRSIPVHAQPILICHDDHSGAYAICMSALDVEGRDRHSICLYNKHFELVSTFNLYELEYCVALLSCSFSDDENVYFCVGTMGFVNRVLVLKDEGSVLTTQEQLRFRVAVRHLHAFHGLLAVSLVGRIMVFMWVLDNAGNRVLRMKSFTATDNCSYIQCFENFIVGAGNTSMFSLFQLPQPDYDFGLLFESADLDRSTMSLFVMLGRSSYLCCNNSGHLYLAHIVENNQGIPFCEVYGDFNLGDRINAFCRGILVPGTPQDLVLFGTDSGCIGTVNYFLQQGQFGTLDRVEVELRQLNSSIGKLDHEQWRSNIFYGQHVDASRFVDGDLIESFFGLDYNDQIAVSDEAWVVLVDLCAVLTEVLNVVTGSVPTKIWML